MEQVSSSITGSRREEPVLVRDIGLDSDRNQVKCQHQAAVEHRGRFEMKGCEWQ